MIYSIFEEGVKTPEPVILKLRLNNYGGATKDVDVSVVAVDSKGNVRPGGFLVTFRQDGKLFLISDVNRGLGFDLDLHRRIVVS